MSLGEFELIARWFTRRSARGDVLLGVGDDAALLAPRPGEALVAATDTLVEGRHFLPGTPADAVGHQALAVNLSDVAAMGADPAWALLSLSLPEADPAWLDGFARGFNALADAHGVALVGGDTVSGPRVITVTVMGSVPTGEALRRSGARSGDLLYVSGTPGVAAAGLELLKSGAEAFESADPCVRRFLRAEPRVALGQGLRGLATAAMDVSDGLLGDARKLAVASGIRLVLELDRVPVAQALAARFDPARCEALVLRGGDDYELLFTAPPAATARLETLARVARCPLHRIGVIVDGGPGGVTCTRNGQPVSMDAASGYDHFAG
jgi:thiamine-monophosphate kinase